MPHTVGWVHDLLCDFREKMIHIIFCARVNFFQELLNLLPCSFLLEGRLVLPGILLRILLSILFMANKGASKFLGANKFSLFTGRSVWSSSCPSLSHLKQGCQDTPSYTSQMQRRWRYLPSAISFSRMNISCACFWMRLHSRFPDSLICLMSTLYSI